MEAYMRKGNILRIKRFPFLDQYMNKQKDKNTLIFTGEKYIE